MIHIIGFLISVGAALRVMWAGVRAFFRVRKNLREHT